MTTQAEFLSFPPGALGEPPVKIRILADGPDWIALEKPESLPTCARPTPSDGTADLESALRNRIREATPAFLSIFRDNTSAVFDLESECAGPVLFAKTKAALGFLREDYGSYRWRFRFYLFLRDAPEKEVIDCDLPIVYHEIEGKSTVSHRRGKKANTRFRKLGANVGLQLWEATTSYLRPHQIRLHAAECGLRIAGETLYNNVPPVTRADLPGKRRPGDARNILIETPAYTLDSLEIPGIVATPLQSTPRKIYRKCTESLLKPNCPSA